MVAETSFEKSFCRICMALCATEVGVKDGKIVQIRPDQGDPLSRGFMCFKGTQAPEQYHGPGRLRGSLRRKSDGNFESVASEDALAEIASQLEKIITESGPESVAVFLGTQCLFSVLNKPTIYSFMDAIGSPRKFTTMTIDQSAKWVAEQRLGIFDAGYQAFDSADVWMIVGSNPLVSMLGGPGLTGFPLHNPIKCLKEAKTRGLKLIVIDPRRTETARQADIFLQPKPGEDATLLAGLLHIILKNGWHDAEFCQTHVEGMEALAEAIEAFTPARVAEKTGITEEQLLAAATMFARDAKRGMAGGGTGTDMGPRSNLSQHLVQTVNAVCGRYAKAGDRISNPGVTIKSRVRYAEVNAPKVRSWETGPKTRVHGLGTMRGEMMSTVLSDEILHEGPGKIRALICIGGNPVVALPDQLKAVEALTTLDLLVTVDPRMSATAQIAHYVIAPTMAYERADHTGSMEYMMPLPYAQYTPAIVAPELGSDVVDDWYVFWRLAQLLGKQLMLGNAAVPMDRRPTTDEMLELQTTGSRIPLAEVKKQRGGRVFDEMDEYVRATRPEKNARLRLTPDDVLESLRELSVELRPAESPNDEFPYRLIVRRDRDVMNSALTDFESLRARKPFNRAFMNPRDIDCLGLCDGDCVKISSAHAQIDAIIGLDESVREGAVSMSHCWPSAVKADQIPEVTSTLVDSERQSESINRMPILTAIPVRVDIQENAARKTTSRLHSL